MDNVQMFDLKLVQKDIFFDQLKDEESPHYNVGGYIKLGSVSEDVMCLAHKELVENNPVFGLRFRWDGEKPIQYISVERSTQLEIVDFSKDGDAIEKAESYIGNLFESQVNIIDCELFKSCLIKVSQEDFRYIGFAHHLLLDGYGFSIWADNLSKIYDSICDGKLSYKPEAFDIEKDASSDSEYLESNSGGCDRKFHLKKYYSVETQSAKSQKKLFPISQDLKKIVYDFSSQSGVSVSHIYLGMLAVYFSSAYAEDQIVFGVTSHNRRTQYQRRQLGVYAGVTPFLVELDKDLTCIDLFETLSKSTLQNYRHGKYPISHMVRDSGASLDQNSLFDICFNYLKLETQIKFSGSSAELVFQSHNHEKNPLMVTIWEYGDNEDGEIQIDFNSEYFSSSEIDLLGRRLTYILKQIIADPGVCVGQVSAIPVEEMSLLTAKESGVKRSFDHKLIHEYLTDLALEKPSQIAYFDSNRQISYESLDTWSDYIASLIKSNDVPSRSVVPVYMDRSIEYVATVYGILKSGCAFAPISTDLSVEHINAILEDLRPEILFARTAFDPSINPGKECRTLLVSENYPKGESNNDSRGDFKEDIDDVAYVLYTSGSTGRPKGVKANHRALLNRMSWMWREFEISGEEKFISKSYIGFVDSIWELFGGVSKGVPTYLASIEESKDVETIMDIVVDHSLTRMVLIPTLLDVMMEDQPRFKQMLCALKYLTVSGEELTADVIAKFREFGSDCKLLNLYGSTEVAGDVTCHIVNADWTNTIGEPIDNVSCIVVGSNNSRLPMGVEGDLVVSGDALLSGYMDTKEDALRIRELNIDGTLKRYYLTGDRARYLSSGALEYLGRADDQVKINGVRVRLDDLSNKIACLSYIKECSIQYIHGDSYKRIVAYVVFDGSIDPQMYSEILQSINSDLSTAVPGFLLPNRVVPLDQIPRLPNGKVDKKGLPAVEIFDGSYDIAVAKTSTEKDLVNVWSEILAIDVSRISIDADYFQLGGDSLAASKMLVKIREISEASVRIKDLFKHSTIRSLAKYLDSVEENARGTAGIPSVNRCKNVPLSLLQKSLWTLEKYDDIGSNYNLVSTLEVEGDFDILCANKAFKYLLTKHEQLRAVFVETELGVFQERKDNYEFNIVVHGESSQADYESCVNKTLVSENNYRFNFADDIKLRVIYITGPESKGTLVVNMPHIVTDGLSLGVIKRDFSDFYRALVNGRQIQLSKKGVGYFDYAIWQDSQYESGYLSSLNKYWTDRLAGIKQFNGLVSDYERSDSDSFEGAVYRQYIDKTSYDNLVKLGVNNKSTLYTVLCSIYSVLLSKYGCGDDIVIGSAVSNREAPELEDIVGFFANTLPIRSNPSSGKTFKNYLLECQENIVADLNAQALPFESIVEQVNPERNPKFNPIFQVVLNLALEFDQEVDLGGSKLSRVENNSVNSNFDISLQASVCDSGLLCEWVYTKSLFDPSTIEGLASSFNHLVSEVLRSPESLISELVLEDNKYEINSEYSKESTTKHFLEVISDRSKDAPDKIALVYEEEHLTYGELMVNVGRFSSYLKERGVERGDRVLVCADRSIELIVSILSVYNIGAVFVPVDPSYPDERIKYTLEDSGAKYILAQDYLLATLPMDGLVPLTLGYEASGEIAAPIGVDMSGEDSAYIIYTSGSSGKPKGVQVSASSVSKKVFSVANYYQIKDSHRFLLFSSICFDASITQLLVPLVQGASLVIRPADVSDPIDILGYIRNNEVTHIHIVPDYLQAIIDVCEKDHFLSTKLEAVICGGDKFSKNLLVKWNELNHDNSISIYNSYGPTEATVTSCIYKYEPSENDCLSYDSLPIGKPLADTKCYVVDESLNTLPQGAVGELLIGGSGIAEGYVNATEVNQSSFIKSDTKKACYYRTGDLVRKLQSGDYIFVGRKDRQVKVRGFRIELGEIEKTINILLKREASVAVINSSENGDKDISVYIEKIVSLDKDDICAYLSEHLPEYMVPREVILIDKIPRTVSGKLDQSSLCLLKSKTQTKKKVLPRNSYEEGLHEIWVELLGNPDVGIGDNFFQLGGHSLLATRLVSAIRKRFDVMFSLKSLFEASSIEEQARLIEEDISSRSSEQMVEELTI